MGRSKRYRVKVKTKRIKTSRDGHVDVGAFVQIPIRIIRAKSLSDKAKLVYCDLCDYWREGVECWPGLERIADDVNASTRTVQRALVELEEAGLIERRRRPNTSSMTIRAGVPADAFEDPSQDVATEVVEESGHDTSVATLKEGSEQYEENSLRDSVAPTSDHAEFVAWFSGWFAQSYREHYAFQGGKDGALVKGLLARYGPEKLRAIVEFMGRDPWYFRKGIDLGLVQAMSSRVVAAMAADRMGDGSVAKKRTRRSVWKKLEDKIVGGHGVCGGMGCDECLGELDRRMKAEGF